MSRFKLEVGDVFSVPIDDSRVGVGQVVAAYGKSAEYFAIFDAVAPDPASIDIDQALRARVIFLALSNDAKLYARHWIVVGNRPVAEDMPLPAWREVFSIEGRVDVVDYSGTRRRSAHESEAELLADRKFVAPMLLEDALRAKHGLEPWREYYSDMAPNEMTTTARLLGVSSAEPVQAATTSGDAPDDYDPDSEQSVFVYFTLEGGGFGTNGMPSSRRKKFSRQNFARPESARSTVTRSAKDKPCCSLTGPTPTRCSRPWSRSCGWCRCSPRTSTSATADQTNPELAETCKPLGHQLDGHHCS